MTTTDQLFWDLDACEGASDYIGRKRSEAVNPGSRALLLRLVEFDFLSLSILERLSSRWYALWHGEEALCTYLAH